MWWPISTPVLLSWRHYGGLGRCLKRVLTLVCTRQVAPANLSRRCQYAWAQMHCDMHVVFLPKVHSLWFAHKHSFLHKKLYERYFARIVLSLWSTLCGYTLTSSVWTQAFRHDKIMIACTHISTHVNLSESCTISTNSRLHKCMLEDTYE
jgi:hypothetical protein